MTCFLSHLVQVINRIFKGIIWHTVEKVKKTTLLMVRILHVCHMRLIVTRCPIQKTVVDLSIVSDFYQTQSLLLVVKDFAEIMMKAWHEKGIACVYIHINRYIHILQIFPLLIF